MNICLSRVHKNIHTHTQNISYYILIVIALDFFQHSVTIISYEETSPTITVSVTSQIHVWPLLGDSGRVVNSLDFCLALLKSLGCFYFWYVLPSQWKVATVNLRILHCQL